MQRLRPSVLRLFNPLTGNKPFFFFFDARRNLAEARRCLAYLNPPAYLIKSRALRSRPDKEEDASRMFHHVCTSSELNLMSDMTWWA
jgi:hypothetical protein